MARRLTALLRLQLPDGFSVRHAVDGGHAVEDEDPVEVVRLVLPDARGQLVAAEENGVAVKVQGLDGDRLGPADHASDLRQAQAALLEILRLATGLAQHRVDEYLVVAGLPR